MIKASGRMRSSRKKIGCKQYRLRAVNASLRILFMDGGVSIKKKKTARNDNTAEVTGSIIALSEWKGG